MWFRATVLALCVLLLGAASSLFIFPPRNNAVVWLPAGLILAVLVRAHNHRWPAYVCASFLAYLVLEFLLGTPPWLNLVWAVGNVLSPLLGALLLRRWEGDSWLSFTRVRDIGVFLLVVGLISPLPSATIGFLSSPLDPETMPFWRQWLGWYLSDSLGTLLITPVLLTWMPEERRLSLPQRPVELGVTCGLLAIAASFIFGPWLPRDFPISLAYACFPFIFWAAVRLGPRGAALTSLLVGVLAVWHTTSGHGPFGEPDTPIPLRMLSVQFFLAVVELSALTLAALASERWQAERTQRLLAQVGTVLAVSLDYRHTLPRIARLVVPRVASGFALWLEYEEGRWQWEAHAGLTPRQEERLREQLRQQPTHLHSWVDPEIGSTVLVRLRRRGRVLGGLALVLIGRRPADVRERSLAEDLAHRCALAVENARLYEEANEAIHIRDEFIAIAAHELRTPVTVLKLHAQGLARLLARLAEATEAQAKLHLVSRQLNRLSQLVERLLDVGRINTGRLQLDREVVDISELLQWKTANLAEELERYGCTLSLRLGSHITGWWDRARLEEALDILLANAMKFGTGHPIELEVDESNNQARITVRDHGIGMTPETAERIFGRFERAVSSREYGGLGLGLFVAREIAEAHGGTLHATSAPGKGATFTMELPVTLLPDMLHEPSAPSGTP